MKSKLYKIIVLTIVMLLSLACFFACKNTGGSNDNVKPSSGLAYEINDDDKTCTITGIGTCSDTELVIPKKIDGYKVTTIGERAFYDCSNLTSVVIPDSVTSIGDRAFCDCYNLTSVVIGAGVTSIGNYAFDGCSSLTSVIIPDSVTTIGYGAFELCFSLTSIVMGDGVTSIGEDAFLGTLSLTSITVDVNNANYKDIDGSLYSKDGKTLIKYVMGEKDFNFIIPDGVTTIGEDAFSAAIFLNSVVIPDSVTSICDYSFDECYSLVEVVNKSRHITVEKGGTDNGLVGYYALSVWNCNDNYVSKLSNDNGYIIYTDGTEKILVGYTGDEKELVLPNYITQIYHGALAFTNVTSVVVGDNVTSIGGCAFARCDSLTSVVIGDGVTSIGSDAFYACESLQYNVKDNLKYLGNTNNPYLYLADVATMDITTANIDENCKLIGEDAFYGCSSLTSVVIPDSVTSLGSSAFSSCDSLTSVVIGDGVTSIGSSAFSSCDNLTSVVIGDSVTSIGDYAFYNCGSLTSIKYRGTRAQWNEITKGYNWDNYTGSYEIIFTYNHQNAKTYNVAVSLIPTSWNALNVNTKSHLVLDYTQDSLYVYDYNADKTGYVLVPAMASSYPVEISMTEEIAQRIGLDAQGDSYSQYQVWRIELRDDLKFENGDVITAQTFVDTMMRLLSYEAQYNQAENVYNKLHILNAENYLKQGSKLQKPLTKIYPAWASQADVWATAVAEMGDEAIFDIAHSYVGAWIDSNYGARYLEAYGGYNGFYYALTGVPVETLDSITGKTINEILADATMTEAWLAALGAWQTDPGEELHFWSYVYTYPVTDFSQVGFFATNDNALILVLDQALDLVTLCENLKLPLVHVPTYDLCTSIVDGIYVNTYGTSVETFVGYGPYTLIEYVQNKMLVFEKNDNWYGHSEQNQFDDTIYEATGIVIREFADSSTSRLMFEKGELDSYDLQASDMVDYVSSPYLYYTDSESTWYLAMNPDMDVLTEMQAATQPINAGYVVNKTVLTIQEFRQALSYSLDREAFTLQLSPTSGIAKALLSNGILVGDVLSGMSYRNLEEAKDAILEYWGLADQVGEGKRFKTKDEAIASITGYDLANAKELFTEAYYKAVEQGLISAEAIATGKWEVQISIGIPVAVDYYNDGAAFLATCWTEAVKGTPFEGHLTFQNLQPLGSTLFSSYLREGKVDLLFGVGYGSSMFDPYLTMLYMVNQSPYDALTNKKAVLVDVEIEGVTYRSSLYNWVECMNGYEINAGVIVDGEATGETVALKYGAGSEQSSRDKILAACEKAYMGLSTLFPLQTDASVSLRGMRIVYETEEYVYGLGYGGIKYLDFTMGDAEWADYIEAQGGTLNYR